VAVTTVIGKQEDLLIIHLVGSEFSQPLYLLLIHAVVRSIHHAPLGIIFISRELREYSTYPLPPLLERLIEDLQKLHKKRPTLQEQLTATTQPTAEA
jgi:hypothetical protein